MSAQLLARHSNCPFRVTPTERSSIFRKQRKRCEFGFCSQITMTPARVDVATPLRWSRRMEMKMKFRLCILAGLLGLSVGCGSNSPSTPSGTSVTGTPVSIVSQSSTLTNTAYAPNPISIAAGGTITWTNNDAVAHTSTGDDGSWNSGTIAPGANFSRMFPSAGTFVYHCTIHPGMVGTVTVR